jgi:hypothetical protein
MRPAMRSTAERVKRAALAASPAPPASACVSRALNSKARRIKIFGFGDLQAPRQTAVQALRSTRFFEEIAHGRKLPVNIAR